MSRSHAGSGNVSFSRLGVREMNANVHHTQQCNVQCRGSRRPQRVSETCFHVQKGRDINASQSVCLQKGPCSSVAERHPPMSSDATRTDDSQGEGRRFDPVLGRPLVFFAPFFAFPSCQTGLSPQNDDINGARVCACVSVRISLERTPAVNIPSSPPAHLGSAGCCP